MRIKNLRVPNSRLTEGSWHNFKILKSVSLDNDDESWFIMLDPLGYKVMMPAAFYERYGFESGQVVRCRVDRINCNGRMFLEPQHPNYIEGKSYEFTLKGNGSRQNITGDKENYMVVEDLLGYQWKVRTLASNDYNTQNEKIWCRIERIKKGRLFLRIDNGVQPYDDLKKGKYYPFTIINETINPDDNSRYLILQDEKNRKHLLKKKHFGHYGLKPCQEINCKLTGLNEDGFLMLEPENPWYKEGNTYFFDIIEIHKLHFTDGYVQEVLLLDDPHGEPIKVFVDRDQLPYLTEQKKIKVKLISVRKSRLEVQILPAN